MDPIKNLADSPDGSHLRGGGQTVPQPPLQRLDDLRHEGDAIRGSIASQWAEPQITLSSHRDWRGNSQSYCADELRLDQYRWRQQCRKLQHGQGPRICSL